MSSFLEKLKKGMRINGLPEETKGVEKVEEEKKKIEEKPVRKKRIIKAIEESKLATAKMPEIKAEKLEVEKIAEEKKENWFETDGQLAIDVYQTETELVIQSAIAGVKPEDLDISIERDIVTIKGRRQKPFDENGDYFTAECYWGSFSREVILPVEIDPERTEAVMKDGILTIRIPKLQREKRRQIKVRV